ncbi:MAG: hypothetical protein ABIF08_03245 [Nanoarchaeota archaeon]
MRTTYLILTAMVALIIASCSGGLENPASPQSKELSAPICVDSNKYIWGYWDVEISEDGQAEIVPVRSAEMHFNALQWLENNPCGNCLKVKNFQVIDPNNWVFDLQIMHPFPGLTKYTGFDVRGIFITDEDYEFPVSDCRIAWGDYFPRLINADGYTRLFNPTQFPSTAPPCLGYISGKYCGTNDLSATLNPFVSYGKDNQRRMFQVGSTETRTVHIRKPAGPIHFGYVVDASWAPPTKEPVTNPVTDFPLKANCSESYEIQVQVGAGLETSAGAEAYIEIEVRDHQGFSSIGKVTIESPQLFNGEVEIEFSGEISIDSGAIYKGVVVNEMGVPIGEYPLLVRVTDTQLDPHFGAVDAWQVHTIEVGHKNGWARTWGGTSDDYGRRITTDTENNVYLGGQFSGTVDFDPSPEIEEHSSNGARDCFFSKFNLDGNFQWTQTWGGTEYEGVGDIIVDKSSGNIYVTGWFEGTVDFDPTNGEDFHTSNGDRDVFLSKFDQNSNFLWARTWGSGGFGILDDYGESVSIGNYDEIYVSGNFNKTVDFDPGPGETKRTANGFQDVFLSKFNSSGEFQWVCTWGNESADFIFSMDFYENNLYMTGKFRGTLDFDPGTGTSDHIANDTDAYLTVINSDGNFQWARTWGGLDEDCGWGVASEKSGIYVTGQFKGTADFDTSSGSDEHTSTGGYDSFLSKFDSSGTFIWARTWGGPDDDQPRRVAINNYSIYVTGAFLGTSDFDPTTEISEYTSTGGYDSFLSKFDSSGTFIWARTWGGTNWDFGYGISSNNLGDVFIVGAFSGISDFDPGLTVDERSSHGGWDAFITKFPPDGNW